MKAELTPAEERLVELLVTMEAVGSKALSAAKKELAKGRGVGDDVDLGTILVDQGAVPQRLIDELLGNVDSRLAVPQTPSGVDEGGAKDEESFPVDPRAAGLGRARRRPSRQGPVALPDRAAPVPHADEDSCSEFEQQAIERAVRRKSQAIKRISGEGQISRSARMPPAVEERDDSLGPFDQSRGPFDDSSLPQGSEERTDGETRSFDPDALAAASARPARKPLARFAPMIAGATMVLLVGAVWLAGRQPDDPAVDPTATASVTPTPEGTAPVTTDSEIEQLFEEPEAVRSPGPAQDHPLTEVEIQATALEAEEDYPAALKLYRALPKALRKRFGSTLIASAEIRLKGLIAYKAEAEKLLSEVEGLRQRKQTTRAVSRLEAFLDAHAEQRESSTGRRVEDALFELILTRDELEEVSPSVTPPEGRKEPEQRAARFAMLAKRGRSIVRGIEQAIADEKARVATLREQEIRRANQITQKDPIDLKLAKGYVVRDAVVVDLNTDGFTVVTKTGDRYGWRWERIQRNDPKLALRIRKIPVRDDVAEDHLRLGRWCLERKMFDEAKRAFGEAVSLNPRMKTRVPDVSAIARSSRIFYGDLVRRNNSLQITYSFEEESQGEDWRLRPKTRGGVNPAKGRFEVSGKGVYLAALTEVGFEDRLDLTATIGEASRGGMVVFGFTTGAATQEEATYLTAVNRTTKEVLLVRLSGGRTVVLERKKHTLKGDKPKITLQARQDKMRVRVGNRTILKTTIDPVWNRTRVLVGGASTSKGSAALQEIVVKGLVRNDWIRKSFGEFDAKLRGLLARSDELTVFAQPAGKAAPEALSAEDAFGKDGVDELALAEYRKGRLKAVVGGGRETSLDMLASASAFTKTIEQAPSFAAAYYRRAMVFDALGRPRLALADLERAIERVPRFYEAITERARHLARQGRLAEAEAGAKQALGIRPDYAPGYSARALVAFHRSELKAALDDLDLALALDPWDTDTRTFRRNVSNVLRGPPWERTYTKSTEHYLVKTDISSERCDEYAEGLEGIRRYYTQLFGEPETDGQKAMVLIFDTAEGFHTYAELTTDDRVESLLGYYLPRYRQLLLYEDKDDATLEETRRVLYHEAFHQFVEDLIPHMPYWLNEGYADYLSATEISEGRVVKRGGRLDGRLRDLKRFLKQGGPVPFARIMQETPAQFYSGPVTAKYAQAWAMVHYFQHGASAVVAKRFARYVRILKDGSPPRRAFREAWKGADWSSIRKSWIEYVERM